MEQSVHQASLALETLRTRRSSLQMMDSAQHAKEQDMTQSEAFSYMGPRGTRDGV